MPRVTTVFTCTHRNHLTIHLVLPCHRLMCFIRSFTHCTFQGKSTALKGLRSSKQQGARCSIARSHQNTHAKALHWAPARSARALNIRLCCHPVSYCRPVRGPGHWNPSEAPRLPAAVLELLRKERLIVAPRLAHHEVVQVIVQVTIIVAVTLTVTVTLPRPVRGNAAAVRGHLGQRGAHKGVAALPAPLRLGRLCNACTCGTQPPNQDVAQRA